MGDTMNDRYNGWTNYETWLCKLWLDNDNELEYFARDARRMLDNGDDAETVINTIAGELSLSWHERAYDQLDGIGFLSDLVTSALGSVNYREIALSIVDDVVATNNN